MTNQPDSSFDLPSWMEAKQALVEQTLEAIFEQHQPSLLSEAMQYSTLGGGKRIRPLLVFAVAEIFGLTNQEVLAPACALELIHSYSLVHDDLPAMDDDELRRGKPSCHIKYDEALAILVGDGLQSLAFEQIAGASLGDATKVKVLNVLSSASSAMVLGQALDIVNVNNVGIYLADLQVIHKNKTGALITSALLMAGHCASLAEDKIAALQKIGDELGMAFQIQDDILDVTAQTQTLGKPAGSDGLEGKVTYVTLLGVEESQRQANQHCESIEQELFKLGRPSNALTALIRYIVSRAN